DSEHSRYVLEPNVSRQQLADSSSLGADSTQLLKVTLGLHTAEVAAARSHKQLVSPLRPNLRISFSPTLGK
ncbi:MAG: hypothetical protein WCA58_01020, partial [Terriglobales bacterium]